MKLDVLQFLGSLKAYLYGDLDKFKQGCEEIEKYESETYTSSTTSSETTNPDATAGTSGFGAMPEVPSKKYRSTIPHALAVFAAMDILGFLIGKASTPDKTSDNIHKFLKEKIKDKNQVNFLIFMYRHGMSHSFFPKLRIGVAAHSTLPKNELFYIDKEDKITLNINCLIEIMKERFNEIMIDPILKANIEIQFDKFEAYEIKKNKVDLEVFKLALKHH